MKNQLPPQRVNGVKIDQSAVQIETYKLIWRPAVYALILNEAGEILVQDNLLNKRLDFPGGGLEIWETRPEGLAREIWEETGLRIRILDLIDIGEHFFQLSNQDNWHAYHFFYHAEITGGEMRDTILAKEPTVNPHWVNPHELTEDDLTIGWDALQKFLRR